MISLIEFRRFRGFEKLAADLSPHAYIVGPNSAGKSTVLEAVALAERCLQRARQKAPPLKHLHRGQTWKAYPLGNIAGSADDPVRFDFGREEASVSIQWCENNRVHIVWPAESEDDPEDGFFYLEVGYGGQPRGLEQARECFPPVTIVPVITPLEQLEELKDPKYVRTQSGTRLASRHFRNHAFNMDAAEEWQTFKEFARPWLPEIELLDVSFNAAQNLLSVYYIEPGSRVPKELAWAGDGLQIWVQILWHIFRAEEPNVVLLDEPDVYLHPDLQRRLVRLLNSMNAQIILASHSADVVAEAPPGGVLWVDRRHSSARRAKNPATLAALNESLGSSFSFAIARSLRSRLVIASESDDGPVIRTIARQIGALCIANEQLVSVLQVRETSSWLGRHDLGAALDEVLPKEIPRILWLGSGLRPAEKNAVLVQALANAGARVHIWAMRDLESYLCSPATIARASGAAPEAVEQRIADVFAHLQDESRSQYVAARSGTSGTSAGRNLSPNDIEIEFERAWATWDRRASLVLGTDLIRELNRWLAQDGYRQVTFLSLARSAQTAKLPAELLTAFMDVDELVG